MSHSIENRYLGELRTHSTHLKSSDTIITDAPVDNNGKGNAFSPTDLVASALCSCMTTVMGICAEKNNFELPGSTAYVTKIMESHPRRISKIIIEINFDDGSSQIRQYSGSGYQHQSIQSIHSFIKKSQKTIFKIFKLRRIGLNHAESRGTALGPSPIDLKYKKKSSA